MLSAHVGVVSYRNSTSNHNHYRGFRAAPGVVSYRNSTSNHNVFGAARIASRLYLIEILHQTTTQNLATATADLLYLIEILHQTTTSLSALPPGSRCILSKFYIKPQLLACYLGSHFVVSYRNSTSNHNIESGKAINILLYLIEILHQTTTRPETLSISMGCILSKFYIKPQPSCSIPRRSSCCILSKFYIKPQPSSV